jgi:hypothetical protein
VDSLRPSGKHDGMVLAGLPFRNELTCKTLFDLVLCLVDDETLGHRLPSRNRTTSFGKTQPYEMRSSDGIRPRRRTIRRGDADRCIHQALAYEGVAPSAGVPDNAARRPPMQLIEPRSTYAGAMLRHHEFSKLREPGGSHEHQTVAVLLTPREDRVRLWDATSLISSVISDTPMKRLRALWNDGHEV